MELSDTDLAELFTSNKPIAPKKKDLTLIHPDWNEVRIELSKKGMTRLLLWEELKAQQPNLYGHSQFNRYYAAYLKKLNPSMRWDAP